MFLCHSTYQSGNYENYFKKSKYGQPIRNCVAVDNNVAAPKATSANLSVRVNTARNTVIAEIDSVTTMKQGQEYVQTISQRIRSFHGSSDW